MIPWFEHLHRRLRLLPRQRNLHTILFAETVALLGFGPSIPFPSPWPYKLVNSPRPAKPPHNGRVLPCLVWPNGVTPW